jgi:hypothetical protein
MAMTSLAGALTLHTTPKAEAAAKSSKRDYYELRQYELDSEEQARGFDVFMEKAMIPALNHIGVDTVGVFQPDEGFSPRYVLLRHNSPGSIASLTQKLLANKRFLKQGAAFLDAPAKNPAYVRMTSSLMIAFGGMPKLEKPVKSPGRIFQLRIYESSSVKTGQLKIEMFDTAEIPLFRKTGLNPVFFGEAIAGDKMPNLTYMVGFESKEEQQAAWKTFVGSPEWKKLSSMPKYSDQKIVSNITNIVLKPTSYSQI